MWWRSCAACCMKSASAIPARSTRWRRGCSCSLSAGRRAPSPSPRRRTRSTAHRCGSAFRPTRGISQARPSAARPVPSPVRSWRRRLRAFAASSCSCRRCTRPSRSGGKSSTRSRGAAARWSAKSASSPFTRSTCSARRTATGCCACTAPRAPMCARCVTTSAKPSAAAAA